MCASPRASNPTTSAPTLFGTMHECGHAMYEQGMNPAYDAHPAGQAAPRWRCTSRSRACGKTWSGARCPSGSTSTRACRRPSPPSLARCRSEDILQGHQQGRALAHPRRSRRSHLQPAHHAAPGTRDRHDRRQAGGQGPAGSLEHEDAGIPAASPRPTTPRACCRISTGRSGCIGYFSTYALGNLISAQLWEKINAGHPRPGRPDPQRANSSALLGWLRENVHTARAQVRAAGAGPEDHRLEDRPRTLHALPDQEIQRDLRTLGTCHCEE
ncbi:MAG: hypothetical protein MZV63_07110 [Marinilabiliales bacterium]|nr:hypothetical protein [Marinilabiliales bacterium]